MLKDMDFCHLQENSKRVVQKTAEATGDLIGKTKHKEIYMPLEKR